MCLLNLQRIAIISDVHGNIPALKSVLADIHTRGVDAIYCLGDLIGKGPQNDLAVDMCQEHCDAVVRGNWDSNISDQDAKEYEDIPWIRKQLGQERLDYLGSLPNSIDLQFASRSLRLFHASQVSEFTRVRVYDSHEKHLQMFENTAFTGLNAPLPDLVGYGDIHAAYVLPSDNHKTLFNVGSVGNPLDQPKACYALLESSAGAQEQPFSIQIIRVPYDIEGAIDIAKKMDMPLFDFYAHELRTAEYRGKLLKRGS